MSSSGGSGSGSMSGAIGGGDFGRAVARAAVAQMLEAAGFTCAHRSAVDALVDVLLRYVCHLGRAATFHANLAGRAVSNECDVVQFLEEFGAAYQGFAGASSAPGSCLVNSGVVKDIVMFVGASNDKPFVRPLPRFPMQRAPPQSAASFAALGRESGMKHVPQWLPAFPESHTYVRTEVWSEKVEKAGVDEAEQVRQWRKAEKSLLSLQQRLALAGADGFRPAVVVDGAGKGKELDVVGSKSNPFLESALPYGEKDVSEVAMPNVGKKLSVLDAFAPAFAESKGEKLERDQDQGQNQKRIVPKERQPVYLRIGIDRKSMVMALNSRALEARKSPWFLKEEGKDDRKRRAELILREAMENPKELTQL